MKLLVLLSLLQAVVGFAPTRQSLSLNDNWAFRHSTQVQNTTKRVDLPHTWNAQDALSGNPSYKRGLGNYTKTLFVEPQWKGHRLFLRFEGANSVTNVFVNGKHIGEHRGGYTAFVFEITDAVQYGAPNQILVRVNNGEQLDVMPLVGDFNFYGGIYRPVSLLITSPACISPLDYGSPGVYLTQTKVTEQRAEVEARVVLSLASSHLTGGAWKVRLTVRDGQKTVVRQETNVAWEPSDSGSASARVPLDITLKKPHLWNGVADPFFYQVEVELLRDGAVCDQVTQPLGLRYYHTHPDQGFFLNGKHLALHGVCRHQDRAEVGNALRPEHHRQDVQLMQEMGVNALRAAHYPQGEAMYDLTDRAGFVVWAEIPFVGPGGYADKGFVDQPAFRENGRQQLIEMIRQHYNHPSICFWGLFNELKSFGDDPLQYVEELNHLAHQEDPSRPTTAATNTDAPFNFVSDHIAWNRYDGWYGGTPASLASFLDQTHAKHPQLKIGISEYGAGASIYHQQDSLVKTSPTSWWHPENWQTYYHIENWKIISSRPFVWGSFIWNMFDFGAAHRTEGDRPGINDKGLVTFDRNVKKDAFYFYKANWNASDPFIHLAGTRCTHYTLPTQDIMAFTTSASAELFVDGVSQGVAQADDVHVVTWKNIPLGPGPHHLLVRTPEGLESSN